MILSLIMSNDSSDKDVVEEYIQAKISYVGFADQLGLEGIVILKTYEGKEFPMRAFSGEVARHISRFQEGDKSTIPTIYNLVEEIAVIQDLLLIEVRVYQSGSVLRANLYFKSRKEYLVLRNYRASDAIALAAYYDIPIKVRKNLFEEAIEQ
jgi:bifunctional DNase/RNase